MTVKIQVRRGTATQWSTSDPILSEGEIGFETNTGKFKIGVGGATHWSTLDYFLDSSDISSLISSAALDTTDDLAEGATNKYASNTRIANALNSGSKTGISFTYNGGVIDTVVSQVQGTTGTQGTTGSTGTQGTTGTTGSQAQQVLRAHKAPQVHREPLALKELLAHRELLVHKEPLVLRVLQDKTVTLVVPHLTTPLALVQLHLTQVLEICALIMPLLHLPQSCTLMLVMLPQQIYHHS